ncbi:ABC transporter substrate-binding protein [Galactobacter valiniphilus]|uniref:ABC transporter substrate-binding protein n=1 Tax=Galactobacter valiniphilus TaxID=2676122 RepID=A0A399JER2_9MICC|nr:ABC transporter substrate-binding protein [Galactobacter valiniphilus]RII43067.1 ABC transporter substrate-binding protein [Galactobacter valiniphilus]
MSHTDPAQTQPAFPPSEEAGPSQASRRTLSPKQRLVAGIGALAVVAAAVGGTALAPNRPTSGGDTQRAAATAAASHGLDTSAAQEGRVHLDQVPAAVQQLKDSGFTPIHAGELTVATTGASAPISFTADDGKTLIGSDVDVAQLIADGLGLKLRVETTAWADWPLGVQSGKYDVVLSNVGVTEERKDLFDFATYRHGLHTFLVTKGPPLKDVKEAKDIAGLKIVVGSGTNQEKILTAWNKANEKAGLAPAELVYYDDQSAALLALKSGRVDASFGPNPTSVYQAQVDPELRTVGRVNAGWPDNSDVGVVTAKGNGLVQPVATVLEAARTSGKLTAALTRWQLQGEQVEKTEVNPKGLPRQTK